MNLRKTFSGLLATVLLLTGSVHAVDLNELFPVLHNDYTGYTDVADTAWYADAAKICYETGLMNGTNNGFEPESTMTVAQAAGLAGRIHHILKGGDGVIPSGTDKWYSNIIDYVKVMARDAGDTVALSRLSYPEEPASRSDFFRFMDLAVTDDLLPPINQISILPDTDEAYILAFYNAGILTGLDDYGSFKGSLTLRRGEAAQMAARIVRPSLRRNFSPKALCPLCKAAEVTPETVFFQHEGGDVLAIPYLNQVVTLANELGEFFWTDLRPDGKTQLVYVKETALSNLGVTSAMGTDAFRNLDIQVFYSRYLEQNPTV